MSNGRCPLISAVVSSRGQVSYSQTELWPDKESPLVSACLLSGPGTPLCPLSFSLKPFILPSTPYLFISFAGFLFPHPFTNFLVSPVLYFSLHLNRDPRCTRPLPRFLPSPFSPSRHFLAFSPSSPRRLSITEMSR